MTPPKTPGRPPVQPSDPAEKSGGRSVYMHLTMPATLYDKSYEVARKQRMTVPEFLGTRCSKRRRIPTVGNFPPSARHGPRAAANVGVQCPTTAPAN
jgi:hypothetical protein